ncbi:MAG: hypothetical protein ACYS9T_09315 [Planctomycetota bacterium]|jgi:hypothetical protein
MDSEHVLIVVLITVNLVAGFGLAIPIAKGLCEINGRQRKVVRYIVVLIGVYFVECIAFSAGMATQVFTVGLAFVWGAVLGFWLRGRASAREVLKLAVSWALYGSLPTVAFCLLILFAMIINGGSILSSEVGRNFGIPAFVPWPLNTILGFCVALGIGTLVLKTVITTGEVGLLLRLGEKAASDGS